MERAQQRDALATMKILRFRTRAFWKGRKPETPREVFTANTMEMLVECIQLMLDTKAENVDQCDGTTGLVNGKEDRISPGNRK